MAKKKNITHYTIQAGAMPVYDPNEVKEYQKRILKRIRANFKMNAKLLEARHEEHQHAIRQMMDSGRIQYARLQNAYTTFKRTVLNFMKEGASLNDAIRKTFNTTYFTPRRISGPTHLLNKIKQIPDLYKEFRKAAGWKSKIDLSQFREDRQNNGYLYKNDVRVLVVQSPKGGAGQIELKIEKLEAESNTWVEVYDAQYDRDVWESMKNQ